MNGSGVPSAPRNIQQIAQELCELFQQQVDELQRGLELPNLEQYLHRGERITQLEAEIRALRHRTS